MILRDSRFHSQLSLGLLCLRPVFFKADVRVLDGFHYLSPLDFVFGTQKALYAGRYIQRCSVSPQMKIICNNENSGEIILYAKFCTHVQFLLRTKDSSNFFAFLCISKLDLNTT